MANLPIDTYWFFYILEKSTGKNISDDLKKLLVNYRLDNFFLFSQLNDNILQRIEKEETENRKISFEFDSGDRILLKELSQEVENRGYDYWNELTEVVSEKYWGLGTPYGIENIIERGFYVDKTKYLQKLIEASGRYFLILPKCFGKTLILETISKICEGKTNKKLLENTYIGKSTTYQWKKYPVFDFNFALLSTITVERFKHSLIHCLQENCQKYNIKYDKNCENIQKLFKDMIDGGLNLKNGYEQKVIILIDEYDQPLYGSLYFSSNKSKHNVITEILKEFFFTLTSYLKNKTHMVLIVGAAKLYMTKILDNSVSNFVNITLDEKVNAIFGFTHSELITVFKNQLDIMCFKMNITKDALLAILKRHFGGYKFCNFSKETIYNPWSIVKCFSEKKIDYNWQAKREKHFYHVAFMDIELMLRAIKDPSFIANNSDMSQLNFDDKYDQLSLKSFLFQTGLLTIDKYNEKTQKYTLKIPNGEAKKLLKKRVEYNQNFPNLINKSDGSWRILENIDSKVFIDCLQSNLCKWPYNNKQCEATAYDMYLCDVLDNIYEVTDDIMRVEDEYASEPSREDLIVTAFKFMYRSQLTHILESVK